MNINFTGRLVLCSSIVFLLSLPSNPAQAFAYIFASETNGVDVVTHPSGYNGTGGVLSVSIGIDPTSANAASMAISVANVIRTFNNLVSTTGNLAFGGATNIPAGEVDFESTLLHELGHSLGLAHVNAATESGLSEPDRNYTKATNGADNIFNLGIGPDLTRGSEDDVRGDDVCLHYFRMSNNNPFTISGTIDNTTYSRDVADLPVGDVYATNADRTVSALVGEGSTEAVMQQGAQYNEAQRSLTADDVAGIRYATAGLDEIVGTADDYTLVLTDAGLDASADIVIDFDNSQTGFAVSQSGGTFLSGSHVAITSNSIYFNTGYSWFFNTVSNAALSVEWAYFNAEPIEDHALLHWTTSEEINNDYFEIQRSHNSDTWIPVGRMTPEYVYANGNNYQFLDHQARQVGDKLYYRIKQVDIDGKSSYSAIEEIKFGIEKSELVTMGPLPILEETYVEVNLIQMESIDLVIRDLSGRVVRSIRKEGMTGSNVWRIGHEILTLPAGVYLMDIKGVTFQESLKFTR